MTTATAELIEVKPIETHEVRGYQIKVIGLKDRASSLVIKDQSTYEESASLLKTVKDMAKLVEESRKKITTPLDIAKKAVMDLFRGPSDELEKLESNLKRIMINYTNEQERLRREAEEKLRKEVAAKEAAEKKRLEERAAKAEASGKAEKAEELRQQAQEVFVPAPTIAPTVQKVAGVSMKQNWKARVIDVNKVPREYMIVNDSMLDKMAKATKGSLVIPGVEFYPEDVLASR